MDLSKIIFIGLIKDKCGTPRGLMFGPMPNVDLGLVQHYLQDLIETFRMDDCRERLFFTGNVFSVHSPNAARRKLYWVLTQKSLGMLELLFTQQGTTFVCAPHVEHFKLVVLDRRYEHLIEKNKENLGLEH